MPGILKLLLLGSFMAVLVVSAQDTEPPEILSFNFDPKVIDRATGDQNIIFTFRLTDATSGVNCGYCCFERISPFSLVHFSFTTDDLVYGDERDGVYSCTVPLPPRGEQGVWRLVCLSLCDQESNCRELHKSDMSHLNYPTIFRVFDSETNPSCLQIIQTISDEEVENGADIEYVITIYNLGETSLTNVELELIFNPKAEIISASPEPERDDCWHFSSIDPDKWANITFLLRLPKTDINFEMDQSVSGEGFVNVANDYSTILQPYPIIESIHLRSDQVEQLLDFESMTARKDSHNELKNRVHGSGDYNCDGQLRYFTEYESKSIMADKNMSARYKQTSLNLYNNRSVSCTSRWSDALQAKNYDYGTSIQGSCRYATELDLESKAKLSDCGLSLEVNSSFEGVGHIGLLSNPDAGILSNLDLNLGYSFTKLPRTTPSFELREDYVGSFRVYEKVEDYRSERSVEGTGFVNVDKQIKNDHRSYESGTGEYVVDEKIEICGNCDKKNISLRYSPAIQNFSTGFQVNCSSLWKEGMWSKMGDVCVISEQFSDLESLEKETISKGQSGTRKVKNSNARTHYDLNEVSTNANFTGKARLQFISRDGDIKDDWSTGEPFPIYISAINFDGPGNDNENPNGEWVEITNRGPEPVNMTGWNLSDEGNKYVYEFPRFTLNPGRTVTVYTGCGMDTDSKLYMGFGKAIWNDDKDTATLKDAEGNIVDKRGTDENWLSHDLNMDESYYGTYSISRKVSLTNTENTPKPEEDEDWLLCDLTPPFVRISAVKFDAPGNDSTNPNGEWINIKNLGTSSAEMTNWTLSDKNNEHIYVFSCFTLPPKSIVTVYTGHGTDTESELYMGFDCEIWDNKEDIATLKDAEGNTTDVMGAEPNLLRSRNWLSCRDLSSVPD